MSYFYLLFSLIAISSPLSAAHNPYLLFRADCFHYGAESVHEIRANGHVTLDGTNVPDAIFINGSLDAINATIGSLHINGTATLDTCVVNEEIELNGALSCSNCTLKKKVALCVKEATFFSCSIDSIEVRFTPDDKITQTIELRGNTIVDHDIIFLEGKGEVILRDNSQVLGDIIDGTCTQM
ncbi:MAG: hypothetical protein K0S07_560 [Chlamydiales bacterium]|jgi:hypothetical protein|nr:hypothetical protein [Chlamydiales bacterium]